MAKGVPEEKIEVVYNWVDEESIVDIQREDNIIYLPVSYTVTAGSFGSNYDSIELPE